MKHDDLLTGNSSVHNSDDEGNAPVAPQVRIGPDGEIIINQARWVKMLLYWREHQFVFFYSSESQYFSQLNWDIYILSIYSPFR